MTTPLLTTKLYIPPARPNLVQRPRLVEQLNEGARLGRKLTLISAPAGFGKTTLVSEWIQSMRRAVAPTAAMGSATPRTAVAWLSLDEGDNDPVRFLSYSIAALRTIEANIAKGALSTLHTSQPQPPPTEVVLTSLINELAAIPERIILILDDYHTVDSSPVDDALSFLLEHLPPYVHLVIATREDPHLPLARLRARGQLTELRATDLRFSPSEAAEFLNRATGLDLSAQDIAALETRTEGWIAGLQLAAVSMQVHKDVTSFIKSFTGSHRYVFDYLIEEVLQQQSASVQSFLLQTAVLDRLTGSLCDAVRFGLSQSPTSAERTAALFGAEEESGADRVDAEGSGGAISPSSQATLEMLERANLFIVPLDEERRWYRYHRLFCDLLRQRLHQVQPDWVSTLHIRASVWYEQNGFAEEAIEHALRAEDFERAADMIEEYIDDIWQLGARTKLRHWLDALPVEVVCSKPHLCILHAAILFTGGEIDEAERRLQAAEQALAPDKIKLRGRAAAVRAHLVSYQGDVQGAIQYARQALAYLPESDSIWRSTAFDCIGTVYSSIGDVASAYQARSEALKASRAARNVYMILNASLRLVVTLRDLGHLQQAIEMCQQQLKRANESGLSQTALVGWLFTLWAEMLAEKNELDSALQLANKGVELTERGNDVILLASSYLCLMRVLFSNGDMDNATAIIKRVNHFSRKQDLSPLIANQMAAWQARIWVAQDKLDSASHWAEKSELDVDGELEPLHDFDYVVLARILIAQGRLDETSRLLQRLFEAAEAGGRTSKAIEILMLQALAFQARGETDWAMTTLTKALTLAEPCGFIRIFVDEGLPMAQLLSESAARGIMPGYTAKLLAVLEAEQQPVLAGRQASPEKSEDASYLPPAPSVRQPIKPLTQRELEVLQLIAQGLSNREISERLFLALSTVKGHNRIIYSKLQVQRRTEAVARARALGLL